MPGDSLAVNGVCLTVIAADRTGVHADISPETARVTTLGTARRGAMVNLERPLRADGRLGGHFVQGHVDATAPVDEIRQDGDSHWLTFRFPAELVELHRSQGFDRGERGQPHRGWRGQAAVRRSGHPVHVGAHQLSRAEVRRRGEHRVRRARASTWRGRSARNSEPAWQRPNSRTPKSPFAPIDKAIDAIRRGEMIIVVDDEDRENEGDLTIAADKITPAAINFMAKHGRGLICVPMTEDRLAELDIPQMVPQNTVALRYGVLRRRRGQARRPARDLGERPRGDGAGS